MGFFLLCTFIFNHEKVNNSLTFLLSEEGSFLMSGIAFDLASVVKDLKTRVGLHFDPVLEHSVSLTTSCGDIERFVRH